MVQGTQGVIRDGAGYSGGTQGWCRVLRGYSGGIRDGAGYSGYSGNACRFQSLIEGLGRGLTIRFGTVAT